MLGKEGKLLHPLVSLSVVPEGVPFSEWPQFIAVASVMKPCSPVMLRDGSSHPSFSNTSSGTIHWTVPQAASASGMKHLSQGHWEQSALLPPSLSPMQALELQRSSKGKCMMGDGGVGWKKGSRVQWVRSRPLVCGVLRGRKMCLGGERRPWVAQCRWVWPILGFSGPLPCGTRFSALQLMRWSNDCITENWGGGC